MRFLFFNNLKYSMYQSFSEFVNEKIHFLSERNSSIFQKNHSETTSNPCFRLETNGDPNRWTEAAKQSLKFEETPRTVSRSRLVGAEEEECREELSPARIRKCPITFEAARRFFSFHVSGRSIVTRVARLLFGTYSIDPQGY